MAIDLPTQRQFADDANLNKADIRRFHSWKIIDASLPNCYAAIDQVSNEQVLIHTFVATNLNEATKSALQTQIKLIERLYDRNSRIVLIDLDADRPFVARSIVDALFVASIETCDLKTGLTCIADLFNVISKATQMRLYHGSLSQNSISIDSDNQHGVYIDYIERFSREAISKQVDVLELYQADIIATLTIAQACVQKLSDRFDPMPDLSPREASLIHKFARETFDPETCDEAFETWLEFFDAWHVPRATDIQDHHISRAATVEVGILDPLNHDMVDRQFDDGTVVANVAPQSAKTNSPFAAQNIDATIGVGGGSTEVQVGSMLGRYRVLRTIGAGGMGAVFQGLDTVDGKFVALKVLKVDAANVTQAIRRFNKEARILASISNEHVTQLFEVGRQDGVHFFAMEYIDGIDLKVWLSHRKMLDEVSALKLIRDIAQALVHAHQRGIIHRDIKPENVLLAKRRINEDQPAIEHELADLIVKLTDFGIAREIEQSQSMEMTRIGGFMGTPKYMSPEQCKGDGTVGTTTDIYSLGITLYELLSGTVPYDGADVMMIAAMHCFDPIPDIRKSNAQVSERTSGLLNRMLAKDATNRPADAAQLLTLIDQILAGTSNAFDCHPILPDFAKGKLWEKTFEWELKSTAAQLWPHVSNTERLNKAAGLPTVEYRTEKDNKIGLRRFGSFKLGALKIEWEEHPFEWVEGSKFGILREFLSGPFKWFMSSVELKSLPEGGTHLVHSVKIEPRNALGRVVSTIEAGWKGGRSLDRVYNRIDASIQSQLAGRDVEDLFEEPVQLSKQAVSRLDAAIDRMIEGGAELQATNQLIDYLRTAPIQELAKIRPVELGKRLEVSSEAMLDACLVAGSIGVLELRWDIICPTCRVAAKTESMLAQIQQHTECEACDTQFQSDLASAIELTFRVHPEIRQTIAGKYCIGGPWHAPHVLTQVRLAPGESMQLPLKLDTGDYLVRTVGSIGSMSLVARPSAIMSSATYRMTQELQSTVPESVRSGMVQLRIENALNVTRTVRVERTIQRDKIVTAASASASQLFRKLYPEQCFGDGAPVATDNMTLLVVRVFGLDDFYLQMGDQAAFDASHKLQQFAETQLIARRGAIVKTTDEGLVAAFADCADAVRAAIELKRGLEASPDRMGLEFGLVIHRGRMLMAKQNGRIDYFGATMRSAVGLASHSRDRILLSDVVAIDPVVREMLVQEQLTAKTVKFENPASSIPVVFAIDC
jgi:eukaryotic-like serine/threonine-protein kinase